MIVRNLDFIISGHGFLKTEGRRPTIDDLGVIRGPVDIEWNESTGRILQIGKSLTPTPGAGVSEWDGTSLFATPGLVDSHTHSLFQGTRADEAFLRLGGATYVEISQRGGGIHRTMTALSQADSLSLLNDLSEKLRQMAQTGITTVEVKSGYGKDAESEISQLKTLQQLKRSPERLPQLKVTFLGLHALPKGVLEKDFVDSMIGILPQVAQEKLADFVDAFPEKGFFSLKESERFVVEALKHGLRAKIHADEITDMSAAETFAKRGALSVDHLQNVSDSAVGFLSTDSCVGTLLPSTSFFLGIPYAPARKLLTAGVRVALASDYNPGTAPELGLGLTMRLAALQYRMTAAEIFCAVTHNGAQALGLAETGVLVPGHHADLCVWKAVDPDPFNNLCHLVLEQARVTQAWSNGRPLTGT